MRDYAKVCPTFWTGETGKKLRESPEAVIVALYLMTSPHSNMIGLYYMPKVMIAHETGLPLEGASKGLQRAIEGGFCEYDENTETVWVKELLHYQVGDLKEGDNQIKGCLKVFENAPKTELKQQFCERYKALFPKGDSKGLGRGLEGPSKGLRSQRAVSSEQRIENKEEKIVAPPRVTQEIEIPPDLMENQTEIRSWLEYKREKGQKYKPTGLKALWKVLREMPKSERAQAINSSMASNYTGIFNNGGKNVTNSYGQNAPVVGSAKPIPGKYANIGIHVKQSENESIGSVFNVSRNTKTGVE